MKRRGSSLLMVVLIMSAISIATVTAASVLLVTQRQSANNDLVDVAQQMARSAVQEALYRQTYGIALGTLTAWGDYGNVTDNGGVLGYPMVAEQRYEGGTNCTDNPHVAQAGTPQTCPYYELAIRDMIAVNPTTSSAWAADSAAFDSQAFMAQDLPSGVSVAIPVLSGSAITLNESAAALGAGGTFGYKMCRTYTGSVCVSGPSNQTSITITPSALEKSILFTFSYSSLPATTNLMNISNCSATSGTYCVIGKGFTTADIVGYAGGQAQVHEIIEFHGTNRTIRQSAQYYNGQGIRLPN